MKRLEDIERALADLLPPCEGPAAELHAAMRWAVEGGGKRIRPLLCLGAAEAVGGAVRDALAPACAIELLHAYTLVHDDLPAMDGDTVRRGRPSVWAKFGEATAILAGDALQALAFAVLARTPVRRAGDAARLLAVFSDAALGVVRGQTADLARPVAPAAVPFVYEHKTADLFIAAVCTGALAGGADEEHLARLRTFALNLGLAFQHQDDVIDGDSPLGADAAARLSRAHTAAALAALDGLPGDTSALRALAARLVERTR